MMEPRTATARADGSDAEHYRRDGALEARVESHHERLGAIEERQRTYDARTQQLQAQIARLADISKSTIEGLDKVERMREEDHRELRTALIEALKAAPRANRAGSVLGLLVAAVAMVMLMLVMTGRLT